jgi:hypothetical protein
LATVRSDREVLKLTSAKAADRYGDQFGLSYGTRLPGVAARASVIALEPTVSLSENPTFPRISAESDQPFDLVVDRARAEWACANDNGASRELDLPTAQQAIAWSQRRLHAGAVNVNDEKGAP